MTDRSAEGSEPAGPRPPVPFGVGPNGASDARSFRTAVAGGLAAWLVLSPIPFAGFLGCALAGWLRRAGPARDTAAGAATGLVGVTVTAAVVAVADPAAALDFPVLHDGSVLYSALGRSALAIYLTVGYLAFVAAFGALLGVLGGHRGSDGYGADETAHQRAIALGEAYRGPVRGDVPVDDDGSPGRLREGGDDGPDHRSGP